MVTNRHPKVGLCPCVDSVIYRLDDAWFQVKAWLRRRRNGYKLFIFFRLQAAVTAGIFVLAVALFVIVNGDITAISSSCTLSTDMYDASLLPAAPLDDEKLRALTDSLGRAVTCTEDIDPGACSKADIDSVLNLIVASGACAGGQMLFSFILAQGFAQFTNLPREALQHGKTSRRSLIFGGICKLFPWPCRLMHFLLMLTLFAYSIVMFPQTMCMGEFPATKKCETVNSECAYVKMRNCQYYYNHCYPTKTEAGLAAVAAVRSSLMSRCLETGIGEGSAVQPVTGIAGQEWMDRDRFSGFVDIRLVTTDECRRCRILRDDLDNIGTAHFWLLNASTAATIAESAVVDCEEDTDGNRLCHEVMEALTDNEPCNQNAAAAAPTPAATAARRLEASTDSALETRGPHPDEQNEWRRLAEEESTQACTGLPSSPSDFHFSESKCSGMTGSYVFRQGRLYCYLAIGGTACLTVLGQVMRSVSRLEPWFFVPMVQNEWKITRFLRYMGP
eukprot:TRINITY_DN123986_c0_g1_i1.p1 TRINITY_DN123986_c0_g1~~TRINITY_DN123986_c0_g1_i1.p1  ORF type:complete len:503 (-),score=86.36 TRINITY_DN123986_c0_g1_i1:86-1594(-)